MNEKELQAEVARLEKELDVERTWHRSTKLSLSDEHASRQYWEREANTDHRGEAQEAKRNEAHARDMERRVTVALKEVEVENKGLRAENARLTSEVARLTEEAARKDAAFEAHVTVTSQISANAIRVADENARLTAEVERLKGREEAAKPFVMACKEPGELDTFCGSCWRYWTEDASGCADGCPRAAWLAGCKS